jgi:hypothetical protein
MSIDYRHVITSLSRKPQAFRYSKLRNYLLPNEKYKQIWEHVDKHFESRNACRFIVGLLSIAAMKNCEEELANEVLYTIANGETPNLNQLQDKYQHRKTTSPIIQVEQHLLSSYNDLIAKEVLYA